MVTAVAFRSLTGVTSAVDPAIGASIAAAG
jgi:hypothetical protein